MKSAFKVLAYLIALGVVVQAASMVFAVAGLGIWVDDGGTFDKASAEAMFEGDVTFTGVAGFMIHGMNGMMVIPALALITFVVSFFAKVPNGIRNAAAVLALVVLQVMLGLFGHENAYVGMLHGVNALVLFTAALYTGLSAGRSTAAEVGRRQETTATV
jgi:hypothetical protein